MLQTCDTNITDALEMFGEGEAARLCLTAPCTALAGLSALPRLYAKAEFYPRILWCFSSVPSVGESNIFRWCKSLMLGQEGLSFG